MSVTRRDLLSVLAATGVLSAANPAGAFAQLLKSEAEGLYDRKPFGNVSLLVTADLHAQLRPHYYMEPPNLLAPKALYQQPGYLTGESFLRYFGLKRGGLEAYFTTYLDFVSLAQKFGMMGGASYLTALLKRQRQLLGADRTLTLDAGDTWTTSGIGLLTGGKAAVDWMNLSGYHHMVAHWEFILGRELFDQRLKELKAQFISFNIVDDQFGDPVYQPYAIHQKSGYSIGVIGSTFPYVKVAHPARFSEGLSFGVRDNELQKYVDEIRGKGVDAVVLLSHNGLPLDSALARRIKGIDLIISAHTHDMTPRPLRVGSTWIVCAGSGGKFVGRVDLEVAKGSLRDLRYQLMPVAPSLLEPDAEAEKLLKEAYAPHQQKLSQVLGTSESLIYKRDTVYSTFDELVGRAVQQAYPEVEIAFSPGFRWGTTIVPGQDITMEQLLSYTAITYPEVYIFKLKGERLKSLLEDIAANVFQPDPFYQQGGDMSRLYGLTYSLYINGKPGERIRNISVGGRPFNPGRDYVLASYGGNLQNTGTILEKYPPRPVYDIVAEYIRSQKSIKLEPKPPVRVLDAAYRLPG